MKSHMYWGRYIVCGLLAAIISATGWAERRIANLRTNYQNCPLGMDENPIFSWEMEAPGEYGARQTAYRICMAESPQALDQGDYIYDTGKQTSDLSVCIPYQGASLKPMTRYYWTVKVWDEKGKEIGARKPACFETALMDVGWDGAQWIGSYASTLSKYMGRPIIDLDLQIAKRSHVATFLLSYRDDDNYLKFVLDISDKAKPQLVVSHKYQGVEHEDMRQDVSYIVGKDKLYAKHHIHIAMETSNHASAYTLDIAIDGKNIKEAYPGKQRGHRLTVDPSKGDPSYKYARLYGIGFMQPEGEEAIYENIKISEEHYNKIYYTDTTIHRIKGNGKAITWEPNADVAAPMMRKEFSISRPVKSARLYATARGIYEMSINGRQVSNDYLNPGWTDYRFRLSYNVYDVSALIQQGNNAVGAVLGKGWYTGNWGYYTQWMDPYGTDISLLAKLVINYQDGSREVIVTDGTWQYTDDGPIVENGLLDGEDYDARREIYEWDKPQYDASKWHQVKIYNPLDSKVVLQPYVGKPVRVDTVCTAIKLTEPLPHHFIYDIGQNVAGIPQIKIKGKRGQRVTLKYAEMLYPEVIPTDPVPPYTREQYEQMRGQMYLDNYRGALSTDNYICSGKGVEIYEPRFTSHGFRYIEVTGLDEAPSLEDVKVLVLNSLQEHTATYATSDTLVNKLYSNIVWGQRGNFQSVPTDCPQRNERCGWTGDAQIFARTASYNRNVQPFFDRWLYSLRDDQSSLGGFPKICPLWERSANTDYNNACPGWADAGIIVPWQMYQQYADKSILDKSYASMKRYMDYMKSKSKDYLQPIYGYGDWVALLGTPSDLTNTAYWAYDAKIMARVARVLGQSEDAIAYDQLFENIKQAFCKRYLGKDGWLLRPAGSPARRDSYSAAYGTGPKTTQDTVLDTQTGYILPLYVGLLDDSVKDKAFAHLVELLKDNQYCLNTGFIGTPYMNLVLSDNGRDDIAYKMFQQHNYPSWIYPILQGATTIWERWNSYTIKSGFGPVSMNSFNHYSYGAVQDWMMAYSAGIQRDELKPGYKHIMLQPRIGGQFSHIGATFHSVYGWIKSQWKSDNAAVNQQTDASKYGYIYTATIPANTTATLTLPVADKRRVKVTVGKQGISSKSTSKDKQTFELTSGTYRFEVR